MADGQIKLPDDAANTGPKSRTMTHVVSGDTVHSRWEGLIDEAGTKLILYTGDPATNAAAVPIRQAGPTPFAVSGPITDAQLRAAPVGVVTPGTNTLAVTVGNFPATQDVRLTGATGALAVTGAFFQATQPVSFGAGGNTVSVGNFPATQAVSLADSAARVLGVVSVSSGTVSASITNAFALDATLTGGTAKAIARGGAKGTTAAADVTSTASGVNHNALDVTLYDAAGNIVDPRSTRALTVADAVNVGQWIGSAAPTIGQKTSANSIPAVLASDQSAIPAYDRPPTTYVSGTAAAGAALTLTLPTPGVGLFHYISAIEIALYSTAARAGAAAPVLTLATNCAFLDKIAFATAGAIGVTDRFTPSLTNPVKVAAVNTATVLNLPIVTSGLWAARISYFNAA